LRRVYILEKVRRGKLIAERDIIPVIRICDAMTPLRYQTREPSFVTNRIISFLEASAAMKTNENRSYYKTIGC
jgi:hypothetical protein